MVDQIKNLRSRLLVLPSILWVAATGALGADSAVDQSYVARTGERVVRQSILLEESVDRVWDLYTTGEGLQSWAAPNAEVDLRIGGTISSNFKVGAGIGEPGTIVTEVISLIPDVEIVLRDDLVHLLTMGGLFEWLDVFPQAFLTELETNGDDVFTTVRFEALAGSQTRLTLFSYGYGEGTAWDQVYEEAKKSNLWFLDSLSKRLEEGPVDWSKEE
jgi:uncharacterized protein YndB with AHSA1/START domain